MSGNHPLLFDPAPVFAVRTPRGRHGFVSQVWGTRGYWTLGAFPGRVEARQTALAFVRSEPQEPAPETPRPHLPRNWHKRREKGHAPRHTWKASDGTVRAWIRKVKGANTWQCRPWLGAQWGSLNLGLYTLDHHGEWAEREAALVAKRFDRLWADGRTVAEVVEQLQREGKVRRDLVVPAAQRGAVRAAPAVAVVARKGRDWRRAVRIVAEWARGNLFGEALSPDALVAHWREVRRRRAEYWADFEQALREGERASEVVELLAA